MSTIGYISTGLSLLLFITFVAEAVDMYGDLPANSWQKDKIRTIAAFGSVAFVLLAIGFFLKT